MTDIRVSTCADGAIEVRIDYWDIEYRVVLDPDDARRLRDRLTEALTEVGA